MTRPCFSPWLRRLNELPAGVRLSTSALETLAVIAYRQPAVRAELEAIRGVQCGEMLRQLSERDLVRIAGRSPELGRPFLYGTTKKFLQVFGLRSLDELPRAQSLRRGTVETQSEPMLLKVSQDPRDTPEESAVKIAIFPDVDPVQEKLLAFPLAAPLSDRSLVELRAEEDFDEEDDDAEDEDDLEDEEEDLEEDDLEEDEWEEVEDDEDEDDWEEEEDEDWDDDEDEDWEEEEEEEEEE